MLDNPKKITAQKVGNQKKDNQKTDNQKSTLESIFEFAQNQRSRGKSIVLVTGVFDVLHREHIAFLKESKKVGDVLIVGIESDRRVKIMKGEDRPINSQSKRKKALENFRIASRVFILPEVFFSPRDHRELILGIKPHLLAVSQHSPFLSEKQKILSEVGGKVLVVLKHNPEISTTKLIQRGLQST
jgi:rfaE bifunctional protein nucleotidyltransferase chain/domain